jgi:hypothetical protein
LAVIALLLAMALAAATYMTASDAGARLFSELTGRDRQQSGTDQSYEIEDRQTIDGITVTVNNARFANNRVGIEYTVTGLPAFTPDDARRFSMRPMLTDASTTPDTRFPMTGGSGIRADSPYGDIEVSPDTIIEVATFDVTQAQTDGSGLQLRFVALVSESFTDRADLQTGPFVFDFSVPFTPSMDRTVIEVDETVEANGALVKLERLIVTPAEVQAVVRIARSSSLPIFTPAITTARPPGGMAGDTPPPTAYITAMLEEPGVYAVKFHNNDDLFGAPGVWELRIQELVSDDRERLSGPWVFEIEIPDEIDMGRD